MLTMKVRDPIAANVDQHRYDGQYFGFRVELPLGLDEFAAVVPNWEPDLIGCLIGTIDTRF